MLPIRSIKERLPIAYVLDRYNVPVEVNGGVRAVCPFHDDTNPSLDVYGLTLERWGCFACGAGGDVLDLLARLAWPGETPEWAAVRDYAVVLLGDLEASTWDGPRTGVSRDFDPEAARAIVAASEARSLDSVRTFLQVKASRHQLVGITAEHLAEAWGVGSRSDEIVVPYWTREGDLLTYKRRTADTRLMTAPGSDFTGRLYGEWRDSDPARPVLLTEGESDAWAANWAAGDQFAVLGLPTGATDRPGERVTPLTRRTVVLAFDGDKAGRQATKLWLEALAPVTADVRVVTIEEGCDLAVYDPAHLRRLLV